MPTVLTRKQKIFEISLFSNTLLKTSLDKGSSKIEDKYINFLLNEYHKLLEDIKVESITLPDEFVSELLIEKLPQSWTDYKQQISLSDLITHIIIEDTNRNVRAKVLSAKANMVEDKLTTKTYEEEPDQNKKNNKFSRPNENNHLQEEGKLLCMWKAKSSCTLV